MRQLHIIRKVTWNEKTTNAEILQRTDLQSIVDTLIDKNLHWLGYVTGWKMKSFQSSCCNFSCAMANETKEDIDMVKINMKECEISSKEWCQATANRVTWRRAIKSKPKS